MKIKQKKAKCKGIKIFIKEDKQEVGRAFLYLLWNDLRGRYFGYLEDVYVDENFRGKGLGNKLVERIIDYAKKNDCYKIVATSRYGRDGVHKMYEKHGFENFGYEFKMYLEDMEQKK